MCTISPKSSIEILWFYYSSIEILEICSTNNTRCQILRSVWNLYPDFM